MEDGLVYMWNGSNNFSGGGGGPSGGPPSGGPTPGGPGPEHKAWHYPPGGRANDVDTTFADLVEMAERNVWKALAEGSIRPEDKVDYYTKQLRLILLKAGEDVGAEEGKKKVNDVYLYKPLYDKTSGHIRQVRKINK